MANKTYYERGDTFVNTNDKPAIIRSGNALTFTEHFKAGGGADLAPATANTLGGVKVGNGLNVASDGTLSVAGVDYSTTEHLTGRKWIDGKDIYEKTIHANDVTLTTTSVIDATIKSNTIDTLVSIIGTVKDDEGSIYECYVSSTDRVVPVVNINGVTLLISNVIVKGYDITIQYTKPTPIEETTNNRTVKKSTSKKG